MFEIWKSQTGLMAQELPKWQNYIDKIHAFRALVDEYNARCVSPSFNKESANTSRTHSRKFLLKAGTGY